MVHGLALAETTPGPLIMVTQYVGFFAGWNAAVAGHAGGLTPLAAATLAAAITTWVTFLPCFYFVLVGAPLVERLAGDRRARASLLGGPPRGGGGHRPPPPLFFPGGVP